jgi:hypothetical protein
LKKKKDKLKKIKDIKTKMKYTKLVNADKLKERDEKGERN